eukprot:GEMP01015082.1.p1 GENE.GEMP01015082.1~~GEMP01015082.1.p1  ORF type:complete len:691 (+),score=70.27 GEMP01015082.1:261-2333(+)
MIYIYRRSHLLFEMMGGPSRSGITLLFLAHIFCNFGALAESPASPCGSAPVLSVMPNESCPDSYYLAETKCDSSVCYGCCNPFQCTCDGGEAAVGKDCPVNGDEACASCDEDHNKLGHLCMLMRCPTGEYGETSCAACKDGEYASSENQLSCDKCHCNSEGIVPGSFCNKQTGQCLCKDLWSGLDCGDASISSNLRRLDSQDDAHECTTVVNPGEHMRNYSSVWGRDDKGVGHARSMLNSAQAWSAERNDKDQYLELNLGKVMKVYGTVVQGRAGSSNGQAVTMYRVEYSNDGMSWHAIQGTFDGVLGDTNRETNFFPSSVLARNIKLIVLEWAEHISMRAGVIACGAPLGHHCNWVNPCEYPNDCLYNTSGIHLCSAYMRGNCTCVAPRAATLIKSSVECKSADVNLGATKDLFGCVQKCRKTPDCQFIVYGKGEKQGRCFWEKTHSRECVEGLENCLYDVYDINNGNVCTELRISNLKFTNGGVNLSGGMDDPFWGTVDVKCKLEVDSVSYTTSIKWESVRPDWGSRMWRFTPRSASSRLTIKCVDDDSRDAAGYDDDIGTYQAAVSALPRHVRSWIQSGDGEVYIEFDTQCLQGPNPASICDKKDCELGDHCQPMSDVSVRVSLHSCYYDNGACSCGYDQPSTSSEQRIMGFFYSYSFECCQPPNAETTGTPASSSSGNSGTEIPGV